MSSEEQTGEKQAQPEGKTHAEAVRDANLAKGWENTSFGKREQPSPEKKKAGWEKRRRNQALARYLLGRKFFGNKIDGASNELRKQFASYFGLTEEEMAGTTNEQALMMQQIGRAIEKGDIDAANMILERAYGKPTQFISVANGTAPPPAINITVMGAGEVPPIQTTEQADNDESKPALPAPTE